jgi:hypothetical protein
METSTDVREKVLKQLDQEEIITLLSKLIQINSVTAEPAMDSNDLKRLTHNL